MRAANAPGQLGDRVTFLGHSTCLIQIAGTRLLTDPVFGHVMWSLRRRQAAVGAASVVAVDVVFISHGHFDHMDLPSLRAIPGRPVVLVPSGLGRVVERAGLGSVHEIRAGDRLRVGTLDIEAVPAVHGRRRLPWVAAEEPLGCLVSAGSSVYFAGDTDRFPAMSELQGRVDLALLPVGGWGPRLGRGHLDPLRAAKVAALIRPALAVPIHWGTLSPMGLSRLMSSRFASPGPDFADAMAREAPGVRVHILAPGDSIGLPGHDATAA